MIAHRDRLLKMEVLFLSVRKRDCSPRMDELKFGYFLKTPSRQSSSTTKSADMPRSSMRSSAA